MQLILSVAFFCPSKHLYRHPIFFMDSMKMKVASLIFCELTFAINISKGRDEFIFFQISLL